MTPETASCFARAFLDLREAFGVPITVNGTTITAIVAEAPFGRELGEGGFSEEGDQEVKVLLSDLPTLPSLGKAGVYNGRPFRISRVAIQPGGLVGEFTARPSRR